MSERYSTITENTHAGDTTDAIVLNVKYVLESPSVILQNEHYKLIIGYTDFSIKKRWMILREGLISEKLR